MLCDNLSTVYLTTNSALHKKSKHFDRDWHYIREQVALGLIETRHIPASLQVADIFTKALPRKAFDSLRNKLGVRVTPTQSLRGDESVAHEAKAQTQAQDEVTKSYLLQRSSKESKLSYSESEERCMDLPPRHLINNPFAPLLSSSAD